MRFLKFLAGSILSIIGFVVVVFAFVAAEPLGIGIGVLILLVGGYLFMRGLLG